MKPVRQGRLALTAAAFLFGAGWPFTKVLLARIPPLPLLAVEVTSAAAFSVAFALWKCCRAPAPRDALAYAALGVLSPGINYALAIGGLALTSASAASLVSALEPIAIVVLSLVLLGESLNRRQSVLVATALVGLILVADPFSPSARVSAIGTLVVAIGVCAGASFVVLQRRAVQLEPLLAVAVQLCAASFTLVAAALLVYGSALFTLVASLPAPYVLATLAGGIALDYFPFLLLLHAARSVSGAASGAAFLMMPVWGVIISALTLGERLTPAEVFGGLIVVASLVILERAKPGQCPRHRS